MSFPPTWRFPANSSRMPAQLRDFTVRDNTCYAAIFPPGTVDNLLFPRFYSSTTLEYFTRKFNNCFRKIIIARESVKDYQRTRTRGKRDPNQRLPVYILLLLEVQVLRLELGMKQEYQGILLPFPGRNLFGFMGRLWSILW